MVSTEGHANMEAMCNPTLCRMSLAVRSKLAQLGLHIGHLEEQLARERQLRAGAAIDDTQLLVACCYTLHLAFPLAKKAQLPERHARLLCRGASIVLGAGQAWLAIQPNPPLDGEINSQPNPDAPPLSPLCLL
jgi:hypothetical protein